MRPFMSFLFIYTEITNKEENYQLEGNVPKETGYLGDVDTSSNESSEPQSSDSEDDISTTLCKGNASLTRK